MRLNVEVNGEGDPVTVFAHGLAGSVEDLRPLAAAAPGTRVLFDQRGHGLSDAPRSGYAAADYAGDLDEIVGRYGATQAAGISIGAGAILALLEHDPDRFTRVVCMLPPPVDGAPSVDAAALERDAAELEARPLADVAAGVLAGLAPLVAGRAHLAQMLRDRVLRMNATGVPRALRAYAVSSAPVDDPARLCAFRGEAMILAHEGDPVHPVSAARRLSELLPGARLHVWQEPLGMYDEHGALAELVGAFLGQSSSVPSAPSIVPF